MQTACSSQLRPRDSAELERPGKIDFRLAGFSLHNYSPVHDECPFAAGEIAPLPGYVLLVLCCICPRRERNN
jgi:hypothetical protein